MPTADTIENVLIIDISCHSGKSGNSGIQHTLAEVPA